MKHKINPVDEKSSSSDTMGNGIEPAESHCTFQISDIEATIKSVKYRAIEQVRVQLINQLSILENEQRCRNESFGDIEMPENFFSWNLTDCLARRTLDMLWLSLLQKQLSPKCLETRKIMTDYAELKRFVNLITDNYLQPDCNVDDTLLDLHSSADYINLLDVLTQEQKSNNKMLNSVIQEQLACQFVRRISDGQVSSTNMEAGFIDDTLEHETMLSYLRQHNASTEEQSERYCESKAIKSESMIKETIIRRDNEVYCGESTMNFYYTEHHALRLRLLQFTKKYENDYEKVMSVNNYTRLSLQNLTTRKQFLTEQIKRYHVEIQEIEADKIAEEQAAIDRERAKAQAEVQLLLEKTISKRKKNQKKNILNDQTKKHKKNQQNET